MPHTPTWSADLQKWFSTHQRPMPWRDDPSPYKVWISEIMLQQTQVATVIPYFERFVERFPDVQSLARADLQTVLQLWEGLGYYSRARHLHQAAQTICDALNGCFPDRATHWKRLPGIGDYTAAAISSIAFNQPEPAVDGNVLRVYSRLCGYRDDISKQAIRHTFREQLRPIIENTDPSSFNQAMMELGALVCTPRVPNCAVCPLRTNCIAHREDLVDVIPSKPRKTKPPHVHDVAVILTNQQNAVLLVRHPAKGLLGGLWGFPQQRRQGREPYLTTMHRLLECLFDSQTKPPSVKRHKIIRHAFSHFSQSIHPFSCQVDITVPPAATAQMAFEEARWCSRQEIATMPLSKAHRTLANMIDCSF